MAAPSITSFDPTILATNVVLNKVIKVTFDQDLLTSSVVPAHFILKHLASNTVIRSTVFYNPIERSVSVLPDTKLWGNSTFRLSVIGEDLSPPTGGIKNLVGEVFSVTEHLDFQTGTEIDAPSSKTVSEIAAEGDLRLPAGVEVRSIIDFNLTSSRPSNGSWGFSGNSFYIKFNNDVTSQQIEDNVTVRMLPFLDEEGWFAMEKSDGSMVFEWQSGSWQSTDPNLFSFSQWELSSTNSGVATFINTGSIPYNAVIEIEASKDMLDIDENYLDDDYQIIFTTRSYPDYVSPRLIRNEIFSVFDELNLEYVHQLVWKWMIDAYRLVGLRDNLNSAGRNIRDYVKCGAALDILKSLMLQKSILAGQTKQLGDFRITYDKGASELGQKSIYDALMKKMEIAKRAINFYNTMPSSFIRSWMSATDPANFRNRLWRNPRVYTNTSGHKFPSHMPVANTKNERDHYLPGSFDSWS